MVGESVLVAIHVPGNAWRCGGKLVLWTANSTNLPVRPKASVHLCPCKPMMFKGNGGMTARRFGGKLIVYLSRALVANVIVFVQVVLTPKPANAATFVPM